MSPERRLRVLTWQVHGHYLWYLSQIPHDLFLVTRPGHPPGYAGRTPGFDWGDNVREIGAEQLAGQEFDCVLYQSRLHWESDRQTLLSPAQRALPAVYLEHEPPREHPSDTRHWAAEAALLVHVTHFNALMWDSGATPVRVIEHGVRIPPGVRWQGDFAIGAVVVNQLRQRGRRFGADLYQQAQERVPLALFGIDSKDTPGGLGEIAGSELPARIARYRFLFNPVRWTSLGLAVVEAMAIGMPVVALATTELPSLIENDRNGWADSNPETLIEVMRRLIADPVTARRWGDGARSTAERRFSITRFVRDWDEALLGVVGRDP